MGHDPWKTVDELLLKLAEKDKRIEQLETDNIELRLEIEQAEFAVNGEWD